jgi:hypothetical protein
VQNLADLAEKRFVFKNEQKASTFVNDGEGNVLGFHKLDNGNSLVYTTDAEGIDVAIEHCPDGSKTFHMAKDSKGLPAMHEFRPDHSEFIYLFNAEKRLEKTVELKANGDKITSWYSPNGRDLIVQEQRQKGGILFRMSNSFAEALIWLHADGTLESHGNERLIKHLRKSFANYLDGAELELAK